ncbi:MAG: DUF5787 family protein [Halobacteriaceae archaeon]
MTDTGEFGFELRFCAWAERHWPPTGAGENPVVVGRQVGTRRRRWDTVIVEADPDGLADRAAFGAETLDSDLLDVLRHAPEEWAWYRDALPDPGYPWRYVRESIHRASDRGILDTRRDGNRIEIRRIAPYPDWVRRLIAIEHKPDLDASAARALSDQLQRDVALGLADEVWLATRATGDRVEPGLLADIPVEAGVLVVDGTEEFAGAVQWHPRSLAVSAPGTRILDRPAGGDHDRSAVRFEYLNPAAKADRRIELAERVYGRGWRSYIETMRPDCRHFTVERQGPGYVPYCRAKDREQRARECAGSCPDFEPEPPAWRQRDWPLEGGPGKTIRGVLSRRQARRRRVDDQS